MLILSKKKVPFGGNEDIPKITVGQYIHFYFDPLLCCLCDQSRPETFLKPRGADGQVMPFLSRFSLPPILAFSRTNSS